MQSPTAIACLNGTICIQEVNDTNFTQSFIAVPDNGWNFVRWNSGGGFLCGDSTNTTCTLSNAPFAGNAAVEAIVASNTTFYLQPVFVQENQPITDTLTVLGNEFAQLYLFFELTWNDINEVCPQMDGGVCDGILNGWDMTGWTWADAVLMNTVFNTYGNIKPPLQNFPDGRTQFNSNWAPAFFQAGWIPTLDLPAALEPRRSVEGWIRDSFQTTGNIGEMRDAYDINLGLDIVRTNFGYPKDLSFSRTGGWFFRPSP